MLSGWGGGTLCATAVALAVGMPQSAFAADLGGNCCADLEERIAELEATTARKGTRKVSLEVSGWLNKTILFWDDGIRSDVYAGIDNDAAQSRWRFTGRAAITPDVTAGFLYEFGGHGAQTSQVSQGNGGDDLGFGQRLRQATVWVESKRLGRVTLGYGSQATDGIAEIDLSRTEAVSGSGVDSWIARFAETPGYNRRMYIHFLGNFDGGRDQLIRYDSPAISGFQLSASLSGGSIYPFDPAPGSLPPIGDKEKEWDIALRYAGEWNGVRFAAGIGYHVGQVVDGPGTGYLAGIDILPYNHKVTGSASLLHVPTGLFLSAAAGWMENLDSFLWPRGDVNTYFYLKGGIQTNPTGLGHTVFYGEYYQMDKDIANDCNPDCWYPGVDTRSAMWGAGIVQHVDAAAMEVYAAYRFYDTPNGHLFNPALADRGDFHMLQLGTRIRF